MLLFIDVWESFTAIGQISSQKWKEANRNRPLTIHEIEKNLASWPSYKHLWHWPCVSHDKFS